MHDCAKDLPGLKEVAVPVILYGFALCQLVSYLAVYFWLQQFGVLLPIRRRTGEVPRPSDGVFLQYKNASRGSLLWAHAFFSSALLTLMALSACPFN